jgi:hypothetical protein
MIRNEGENVDAIEVVKRSLGERQIRQSRVDNCELIEVSLTDTVRRQIKLDVGRSYLAVYTYDQQLRSERRENIDKLLQFVASINEGLSLTGLDYNLETTEFRYKSSQCFPKGVDFEPVLRFFYDLHDKHLPFLVHNIQNFLSNHFDPTTPAKDFLNSIKTL